MKTKFYILLLIINLTALAQNLVPNPSFENYSNCPSNQSQITYAIPWENHNNSGTPSDYLNSCATNPGYSTPSNWEIATKFLQLETLIFPYLRGFIVLMK